MRPWTPTTTHTSTEAAFVLLRSFPCESPTRYPIAPTIRPPVANTGSPEPLYAAAARLGPADKGYQGAGIGIHTPAKAPLDGNVLDVDPAARVNC